MRTEGPITVEAYMAACNAHYYATRDPLGRAGDFTTAPEISQLFGELVGAALADCWLRAGRPAAARYVELGPGRGTLAADALRVLARAGVEPPVDLVETSPVLRSAQARVLPEASWHDDLTTLADGPLLLVANEFLDALPVRQWVGGEERRVGLAGERLRFVPPDGTVAEDSPARDSAVAAIASRLAGQGGVALVIDYGHFRGGPGDTLQAVRGHRFADPLAHPGEQDLTAHVDFAAIVDLATTAGAVVHGPVGQGEWLRRLGIDVRARQLAAARPDRSADIEAGRKRLCSADAMGELFKVVALTARDWPATEGFHA